MPKPRKTKKTPPRAPTRHKERRIVPMDQGPLRRKAASECARLMSRLEKARAERMRFEGKDVPAFDRWMAATFGVLLTHSRKLDALIQEKECLIQEIEDEMFCTGARPHTAWRRVTQNRAHPREDHGGPRQNEPPPDPPDSTGTDEFDQEILFEEVLRNLMGINPDRLDDASYESMFREFKSKVYGHGGDHGPPPFSASFPKTKSPRQDEARIKEIYRILVRRLHPDLRADGDARVSSLWHEVQEAYSAANLDRLETLLALTDMQAGKLDDQTSLFQMRSVLAELQRDLKALQKSMRHARKDNAWNFSLAGAGKALQARISRELEAARQERERRLAELQSLLDSWATPSGSQKRTPPAFSHNQENFAF